MSSSYRLLLCTILIIILGAGCKPAPVQLPALPTESSVATNLPVPTAASPVSEFLPPTPTAAPLDIPYELISQESLFAYLEDFNFHPTLLRLAQFCQQRGSRRSGLCG